MSVVKIGRIIFVIVIDFWVLFLLVEEEVLWILEMLLICVVFYSNVFKNI